MFNAELSWGPTVERKDTRKSAQAAAALSQSSATSSSSSEPRSPPLNNGFGNLKIAKRLRRHGKYEPLELTKGIVKGGSASDTEAENAKYGQFAELDSPGIFELPGAIVDRPLATTMAVVSDREYDELPFRFPGPPQVSKST